MERARRGLWQPKAKPTLSLAPSRRITADAYGLLRYTADAYGLLSGHAKQLGPSPTQPAPSVYGVLAPTVRERGPSLPETLSRAAIA